MFGSSVNGFGTKSSDLDLCLKFKGHDQVCVRASHALYESVVYKSVGLLVQCTVSHCHIVTMCQLLCGTS